MKTANVRTFGGLAPLLRVTAIIPAAICGLMSGAHSSAQDAIDEDRVAEPRSGLVVFYTDGVRTVSRIDDRLAFYLDAEEAPHPLIDPAQWSAHWAGTIDVREPGQYRFSASVRGHLRLSVKGTPVLEVDSGDADGAVRGSGPLIDLPYGESRLTADLTLNHGKGAELRLFARRPDGFEESLLPAAFHHDASDESDALQHWREFDQGRELIARSACLACHALETASGASLSLLPTPAPVLTDDLPEYQSGWLAHWLRSPRSQRRDATMPQLFGDDPAESLDLMAVQTFLETGAAPHGTKGHVSQHETDTDESNGRRVFATTGCVACHSYPDEQIESNGMRRLDDARRKFSRGTLRVFLFAADAGRPDRSASQHQPSFDPTAFTVRQQEQLLDILSGETNADKTDHTRPDPPSPEHVIERFATLTSDVERQTAFSALPEAARLVELGRVVFQRRGCANCHAPAFDPSGKRVATSFDVLTQRVDAGRDAWRNFGCLAQGRQPGVPYYSFSESERTAVIAVLRELAGVSATWRAPLDRFQIALQRMGCTACHARSAAATPFAQRRPQFAPLGLDRTLLDVTPPSLVAVGERLRPDWLRDVLLTHQRVRPQLDVRMPQYRSTDVEPLISQFAKADGLDPENALPEPRVSSDAARQAGRELVGRTGLNCIGCHDFGEHAPAGGVRAPDLATTPRRLQFEWFRRWLHDPQSITPGTRMPTNFRGGRSALPTVLDGNESSQITALWEYLSNLNSESPLLPTPAGTLARLGETDSPLPINRPLLVHGFLPRDAGLRGIALGFPDGVHFAFNSETCGLTRVWTGPFVHHAGWTGSGKGDVEANALTILGDVVWRDDAGQQVEFMAADGTPRPVKTRFSECWTLQAEAGFAWDARLEDGRRVRIEERLVPLRGLGPVAFRRSLTIIDASPDDGIAIRAGTWPVRSSPPAGGELPVDSWVRISQGASDWLIRCRIDTGDEHGKLTWDNSNAGHADRQLWLRSSGAGNPQTISLTYIRVASGAEPPQLADE